MPVIQRPLEPKDNMPSATKFIAACALLAGATAAFSQNVVNLAPQNVLQLSAAGTIAQTEPLLALDIADGVLTAGVTVEVDISRAYVNSPAAGVVYEIDYADDARVARTLDVPGAALMVETGR